LSGFSAHKKARASFATGKTATTTATRTATRTAASLAVAGLAAAALGAPPAAIAAVKPVGRIIATATDPRGGYWEVSSNGGVYSFGGAKFYGSLPSDKVKTNTVVGICSTKDGAGYWLLSSTGTVYPFGDAPKLGNASKGASAIIADGEGYRVIYLDGKSKAFLPVARGVTTKTAPTTTVPSSALSTAPPASLMPDSVFDSNVQSWPVDPGSSAIVANIVAQSQSAYNGVTVNFDRPVYEVPADQPMVRVSVAPGCNNFTVETGTKAPIPPYAVAGDSSDKILTVYQPSSKKAWEFWLAADNNGSWSACWGGELDMATSTGVFPQPYGETGSGISNLATEITEADVASGSIDHTIGFEVLGDECDWDNSTIYGGLYPASRSDCGEQIAGAPKEGQWFRFPADLAMPSGLAPFAQMVFKAVQTYGMVVVDQGGSVSLEADQPSVWAAEGNSGTDPITRSLNGDQVYQVIAGLPWSSLQVVDPPQH
jgi:hypothetical protein